MDGTTLTSAEKDVCASFSDNFETLVFGYDGVGLKDMSSGGGGSTLSALDILLNRLNLEGTKAAAFDEGEMASVLIEFSRASRRNYDGWHDEQARVVGQRYVQVLVTCAINGHDDLSHPTVGDWDGLVEWISGVKNPSAVFGEQVTLKQLCGVLERTTSQQLADRLAEDREYAAIVASFFAGAALTACPSQLDRASDVLDQSLDRFAWVP